MPLSESLNKVEMAKEDTLDSYLLLPCREDRTDDASANSGLKLEHSVCGWFEVENSPLRINTVYFIGNPKQLKNQLKRREGIDIEGAIGKFDENFKGLSGLTFPINRPDESSLVVIWMPKFDWSILDIETLSHECLHASVMVMRMSGVRSRIFTATREIDVDDEGLCYRQATMFSKLIKKMVWKQNKMFKKALKADKSEHSKS